MTLLRRVVPAIAALLVALVAVQSTDLVACADEVAIAAHAGDTHVDAPLAPGAHQVPAPGGDHNDGPDHGHDGPTADCLCHVVFAPVAFVPAVGARPTRSGEALPAVVDTPPQVGPLGLDHVPLARGPSARLT
jgi:hypothetical protein